LILPRIDEDEPLNSLSNTHPSSALSNCLLIIPRYSSGQNRRLIRKVSWRSCIRLVGCLRERENDVPFLQSKKVESVQSSVEQHAIHSTLNSMLNRYSRTSSVSSMLSQLKWQPMVERRRHARLVNQLVSIRIPLTSKFHLQPTRTENIFAYNIPSSNCDYHLQSFFPRISCSGLEYATTGSRSAGHYRGFPTCPSYRLKTAGVLHATVV